MLVAFLALRLGVDDRSAIVLVLLALLVALGAFEFGFLGGMAGALAALGLLALWNELAGVHLGASSYLSRGSAFLVVGGTVAILAAQLRASERRHARAAAELRASNAELERSNVELDHFASVAAHDLSQPLGGISNFAQLLRQRHESTLGSEGVEVLQSIVEGTEDMRGVVDSLLDYSRAGAGDDRTAPVDCARLVPAVLATLDTTGVEIDIGDLPTFEADPSQIRRLFRNLLSNALKFTNGRPPHVQVRAEPAGPGWRFSVEDNGVGVRPADRDRIFEVFQRAHGGYPGSGIGLAVCRKVVEGYGGSIWVEPVPSGGSAFRFTLHGHAGAAPLRAGQPPPLV